MHTRTHTRSLPNMACVLQSAKNKYKCFPSDLDIFPCHCYYSMSVVVFSNLGKCMYAALVCHVCLCEYMTALYMYE